MPKNGSFELRPCEKQTFDFDLRRIEHIIPLSRSNSSHSLFVCTHEATTLLFFHSPLSPLEKTAAPSANETLETLYSIGLDKLVSSQKSQKTKETFLFPQKFTQCHISQLICQSPSKLKFILVLSSFELVFLQFKCATGPEIPPKIELEFVQVIRSFPSDIISLFSQYCKGGFRSGTIINVLSIQDNDQIKVLLTSPSNLSSSIKTFSLPAQTARKGITEISNAFITKENTLVLTLFKKSLQAFIHVKNYVYHRSQLVCAWSMEDNQAVPMDPKINNKLSEIYHWESRNLVVSLHIFLFTGLSTLVFWKETQEEESMELDEETKKPTQKEMKKAPLFRLKQKPKGNSSILSFLTKRQSSVSVETQETQNGREGRRKLSLVYEQNFSKNIRVFFGAYMIVMESSDAKFSFVVSHYDYVQATNSIQKVAVYLANEKLGAELYHTFFNTEKWIRLSDFSFIFEDKAESGFQRLFGESIRPKTKEMRVQISQIKPKKKVLDFFMLQSQLYGVVLNDGSRKIIQIFEATVSSPLYERDFTTGYSMIGFLDHCHLAFVFVPKEQVFQRIRLINFVKKTEMEMNSLEIMKGISVHRVLVICQALRCFLIVSTLNQLIAVAPYSDKKAVLISKVDASLLSKTEINPLQNELLVMRYRLPSQLLFSKINLKNITNFRRSNYSMTPSKCHDQLRDRFGVSMQSSNRIKSTRVYFMKSSFFLFIVKVKTEQKLSKEESESQTQKTSVKGKAKKPNDQQCFAILFNHKTTETLHVIKVHSFKKMLIVSSKFFLFESYNSTKSGVFLRLKNKSVSYKELPCSHELNVEREVTHKVPLKEREAFAFYDSKNSSYLCLAKMSQFDQEYCATAHKILQKVPFSKVIISEIITMIVQSLYLPSLNQI